MRYARIALLAAALVPAASFAQGQTAGPVLTLEEAIQLALRNNPQHLITISARSRAGTDLRTSYGTFLPTIDSRFGTSFRAGGNELVAGQQLGASSDQLGSSYSLSILGQYSAAALVAPRQLRANLEAAEGDVRASEQQTRMTAVQQYLGALQAQARSALQDTLLINVQAQLDLARARQQVGAGTVLDVRNAEVQVGRQQVAILRERNNLEIAMLQLFQTLGVPALTGARLTTSFPMTEPTIQLTELLDMAKKGNPSLNAARARENAANAGVSSARLQFLPSLGFSTGISGFTQKSTNIEPQIAQSQAAAVLNRSSCFTQDSIRVGAGLPPSGRNCSAIAFTDADAAALRSRNDQFPFGFTKQPFSYSIGLSLPLFNGFRREQTIQVAQLSRNEARYQIRSQELRINTDVTSRFRDLMTDYQMVKLNEQIQQAAREALQLAQERYRVGANTFLDVTNAQSTFQQAATDLINSIYEFHKAYAALENAVGRPLR